MRMLRLVGRGALLGLLAGLLSVWAFVGMLGVGFMGFAWLAAIMNVFSRPEESATLTLIGPAFAGLMIICGSIIGLPLGAPLGAAAGAVIGVVVAATFRWLSPARGAGLGVVVSAGLVALVHLWILTYDPPPTPKEYILFGIIPGLLAICAGGGVGWWLVATEQRRSQARPPQETSGE